MITLSEPLPPQTVEKYDIAPDGVTPITKFNSIVVFVVAPGLRTSF